MPQRHQRQLGLTLVELMVAMVVGLSVIGAGLAMYVSSGSSSATSSQISQMSEDANAALSLLRTHLAMAGYSRPVGTSSDGFTKLYTGPAIFGCQTGLDATSTSQLITAGATLTCDASSPPTNDTLIVVYEADANNTVPTAANEGTDCLGHAVPALSNATYGITSYYLAENRFYLSADGTFLCRGNGNKSGTPGTPGTPQPLVENIADFLVMYGVSTPVSAGATATPGTVAQRYLTAAEVGAQGSDSWNNVVSVRLCVVVRSEDNALDQPTAYQNCHGKIITPTTWGTTSRPDKRSYRLFTSTVVLRNRAQQSLE